MVAIKGTTMKTEFKSICDRTTKGESTGGPRDCPWGPK